MGDRIERPVRPGLPCDGARPSARPLAILEGQCGLFGFGSRALTEVAKELGASVAVMLNRRNNLSSLSMRATGLDPDSFNLGQFVSEFTAQHGIVGGGHPNSAGAKIPTASVPAFLHEVYCFA